MVFTEIEETFGAQTLNRTPLFETLAPNSNVHKFLDTSQLLIVNEHPARKHRSLGED
jgi:hypothetical protein